MAIGNLVLHLHIPGCTSLKEKRSRLKPLLARLHREFNVSVAEMDYQDRWQETVIACVMVNSDRRHLERSLPQVTHWIEQSWPDLELVNDELELF